jgi:hypothetical protein
MTRPRTNADFKLRLAGVGITTFVRLRRTKSTRIGMPSGKEGWFGATSSLERVNREATRRREGMPIASPGWAYQNVGPMPQTRLVLGANRHDMFCATAWEDNRRDRHPEMICGQLMFAAVVSGGLPHSAPPRVRVYDGRRLHLRPSLVRSTISQSRDTKCQVDQGREIARIGAALFCEGNQAIASSHLNFRGE